MVPTSYIVQQLTTNSKTSRWEHALCVEIRSTKTIIRLLLNFIFTKMFGSSTKDHIKSKDESAHEKTSSSFLYVYGVFSGWIKKMNHLCCGVKIDPTPQWPIELDTMMFAYGEKKKTTTSTGFSIRNKNSSVFVRPTKKMTARTQCGAHSDGMVCCSAEYSVPELQWQ